MPRLLPAEPSPTQGDDGAAAGVDAASAERRRVASDMLVGLVAQLAAGVAYTPVDILKERMQVGVQFCYCHLPLWVWAREWVVVAGGEEWGGGEGRGCA